MKRKIVGAEKKVEEKKSRKKSGKREPGQSNWRNWKTKTSKGEIAGRNLMETSRVQTGASHCPLTDENGDGK